MAFSRAMKLEYKRVQFTPDVLPSDLTGFSIYRREEEKFVYQPGSGFRNLLLADEINRTSPKTQSAFPEAQMDRFMISMSLGYPDYESELSMAKGISPEKRYAGIQLGIVPAILGLVFQILFWSAFR